MAAVTPWAKSSVRACFFVVLAFAAAHTSAAQSPERWQAFAGYAPMNDITDRVTFPRGWVVSAAGHVNRWLSLAVDVDGQYKTIASIGSDVHLSSHAITGGLRASAPLGRFVEFGQVLLGVVQSTGTLFGSTETTRHLGLQPGAGLDYPLGEHWAIRGELDLRFLATGREFRVATGIVRAFR